MVAVGNSLQCGFFRHLVEFVSIESLTCFLCQGSIFVHASLVGVDVLQVRKGSLCFFRVRIFLNHALIGSDGSIGLLVLVVNHTDFVASLSCVGALWIFLNERSEAIHCLLFLTHLHVGTSLLEECVGAVF